MMSLRELSRCLVHLVRCGGRDKDDLIARREEDILAYNLDLPVMHQYCTFPELSASCDSAHEALNEPADFWAQAPY